MKKALIYLAIAAVSFTSCRKDDTSSTTIQEVSDLTTQNANDDKAIAKYMDEHYLDALGRIKAFSSTDASDDGYTKLSDLSYTKLESGVIIIVRDGAQPENGVTIGETDIIRLMHKSTAFLSNENNGIQYTSEITFANTLESTGVPEVDPTYYYAKPSTITNSGQSRAYFEIEGLREGLSHFKSFDKTDSENYNLQGVIIVPSRAAFARDSHYPYANIDWRNRTFVFNFQVYKTSARD